MAHGEDENKAVLQVSSVNEDEVDKEQSDEEQSIEDQLSESQSNEDEQTEDQPNESEADIQTPKKYRSSALALWKHHPNFGKQLFVSLSGVFGVLSLGVTYGFLPQLVLHLQDLEPEKYRSYSTYFSFAAFLTGIYASCIAMAEVGRQPAVLFSNVPWLLGYILLMLPRNYYVYQIGFICIDFAFGFYENSVLVYVTEITEPGLRGFFLAFLNVFFGVGNLLARTMSSIFKSRQRLQLCAILPFITAMVAIGKPESPYWLLLIGDEKRARKNFFWLYSGGYRQSYFDDLLAYQAVNETKMKLSFSDKYFSKDFLLPMAVITLMYMILLLASPDILFEYMYIEVDQVPWLLTSDRTALIFDLIRVLMSCLSCILIPKLGRRKVYFISVIGTIVPVVFVIIGIRMYFSTITMAVLVLCFATFIYFGMFSMPWIMRTEVFPQISRPIGSGIVQGYLYVVSNIMKDKFNLYTVAASYGVAEYFTFVYMIVIIGAVLLFYLMPETEGLALWEIENTRIYKYRKSSGPSDTEARGARADTDDNI